MTLGFIAAYDESLAMAIIASKGIGPLKEALIKEPDDNIKAASAWSLGQIGGHSAEHARAMAEADVPSHLLAVSFISKRVLRLSYATNLKNSLLAKNIVTGPFLISLYILIIIIYQIIIIEYS